ncbi:hypothetical protein [Bacillus sp. KH172YL63]|uniref:hypothetical protein n=1 Tax=Bacillus sp. KH172YL63 TaxID=2709784 RepID=UPI0013E4FCFF|nr:hypothetical protein [Bacillus sp. KH172YL63]BCB04156.1 hypothetical protein KH172YL63_22890 [Bacillus sp. KH172YL63]
MNKQFFIIIPVAFLLIVALVYTGPFEQALWLRFVYVFFTAVFAQAAYRNGNRLQFTVISICLLVGLSSIVMTLAG